MGYVIERLDGSVDGMGEVVVFASEADAWDAASAAFGGGDEDVRDWLRVREIDGDDYAAHLGAQCAADAYKAGGGATGPWDETGIPEEPQAGDWDYLRAQLPTTPTRADERAFARAYAARLRALVEGA